MILKNIFGKTIEAARESAQQMFGDDFLVIETKEADASGQASITIFSDAKKEKEQAAQPSQKPTVSREEEKPGVTFERSQEAKTSPKPPSKKDTLSSLRKHAQELDHIKFNGTEQTHLNGKNNAPAEKDSPDDDDTNTTGAYSRSAFRKSPANGRTAGSKHSTNGTMLNNNGTDQPKRENKFLTHFQQSEKSKAKQQRPLVVGPNRSDDREVKALHKRFDKLEALLDSSLISANLDYASHPVFQQLVQTGISTSVIAGWFSQIIEKGVDPYDHPDSFVSKLGQLIKKAVGDGAKTDPQKYMLFVGPSGSGKTNLIMKLSEHPELMEDKKIAVVSVYPPENDSSPYYTILKPFCKDQGIPYYEIKSPLDVNNLLNEWEAFDHVLIDTPSINIEQEHSFRKFWKIRQMLTPLTPIEIHYVANASLNRFYFRNSTASHHPLQPDYVAITHLDEVSQWGPVIPFLQEMGCSARYISKGKAQPASLDEFDPRWFVQKILEEN
jgi:flagellar biosynthesis GTPase FlhF